MNLTLCQPLTPVPSPHPMGRGEIYCRDRLPGVAVSRPDPGLISGGPFRALRLPEKTPRVRGSHTYKEMRENQKTGRGEDHPPGGRVVLPSLPLD